jgi:hypothetical protein
MKQKLHQNTYKYLHICSLKFFLIYVILSYNSENPCIIFTFRNSYAIYSPCIYLTVWLLLLVSRSIFSAAISLIWLRLITIIIVNMNLKVAEITIRVFSSYQLHTWLYCTYLIITHSYISAPEGYFEITIFISTYIFKKILK